MRRRYAYINLVASIWRHQCGGIDGPTLIDIDAPKFPSPAFINCLFLRDLQNELAEIFSTKKHL